MISLCYFFFNDTATTEIYTLSLHDALPIYANELGEARAEGAQRRAAYLEADLGDAELAAAQQRHRALDAARHEVDRKSTRLNSSHSSISYAVFCLKKKKKKHTKNRLPLRTR